MGIPTLFGERAVMRDWGRIGSPGTLCADIHDDEGQAVTALAEIAQKKVKRGYRAV